MRNPYMVDFWTGVENLECAGPADDPLCAAQEKNERISK